MLSQEQHKLLKELPSVDTVIAYILSNKKYSKTPKLLLVSCIRSSIEYYRSKIFNGSIILGKHPFFKIILKDVKSRISNVMSDGLCRVVNATGVVIHTNLGRSFLPTEIVEKLVLISSYYSNLEFDLSNGGRGIRSSVVESVLCQITGAEAAFIVNNNAGAVLICLDTIARSKEVVISRGELVEIGGSFRIPDIMEKSGSIIKEVGTTNRTHVSDYISGITKDTGLLMKVHTSNYSIVGFTASVSLSELVSLGKEKSLPVMEDLGSGTFIDFRKYGFKYEPTVQDSIKKGIDVVTFSGDKLLGGPQAGIILGKKKYLHNIRKNPLARALRIDKLALATLEATLKLYYNENDAVSKIPTLKMLLQSVSELERKISKLYVKIKTLFGKYRISADIKILDKPSLPGGGSMPLSTFPSKCLGISIKGVSVNAIEKTMRNNSVPIIGRIEENLYMLDSRTIDEKDFCLIEDAFRNLLKDLS